ncbi:MAG: alkaline phosphatase family protein, partial [Promethearchaeota archaeon]
HTGKHCEEFGVFIITGPKIKHGIKLDDIQPYDITPTILSLFGEPISEDIDGKVLKEVFNSDHLANL